MNKASWECHAEWMAYRLYSTFCVWLLFQPINNHSSVKTYVVLPSLLRGQKETRVRAEVIRMINRVFPLKLMPLKHLNPAQQLDAKLWGFKNRWPSSPSFSSRNDAICRLRPFIDFTGAQKRTGLEVLGRKITAAPSLFVCLFPIQRNASARMCCGLTCAGACWLLRLQLD